MKRSLLFSAALVAASAAFAAAPTLQKVDPSKFTAGPKTPAIAPKANTRAMDSFDFTYAGDPYTAYALNNMKAGVSRVFLFFEMQPEDIKTFAGSQVTGFGLYSPTDYNGTLNPIANGRFYYSTNPELTSADYAQDFNFNTSPFEFQSVAIDTPYTITGEEEALYFGYSLVVEDDSYYLTVDGENNAPTTGILGVSENESLPTQYQVFGSVYGALCMSVTLERENLPKFVSFTSFPEYICLKQGQPLSLPVTLSATSGVPIESISLEYTLGGNLNEFTYRSATPMPAGAGRQLSVNIDFPAQNDKFKETVEFKLTKINGDDNICEGNTASATVVVVDEVPVRQTLFEEYTCTKCTWCPRGFAALEYIAKNYPDFVTASYHNNMQGADPMTVVSNFPSNISGNPSAYLNRMEEMDPFYGNQEYMDMTVPMVGNILALNQIPTVWGISVSHEWESSDILVAKAEVANMAGYENENYTIAYLLVADGLTGKGYSWSQTNGYASYAPDASYPDELNAFCSGGVHGKPSVAGLVFNDVVISGDGIHGIEGSVPTSLESEVKVTHSFSFDLSKITSSLNIDRNKLRVIAMVLDKNGQVLNCAKNEVNDHAATAVEGIESADNAPAEYYNLNGMKVAEPTNGIYIRRQGDKAEKVTIR